MGGQETTQGPSQLRRAAGVLVLTGVMAIGVSAGAARHGGVQGSPEHGFVTFYQDIAPIVYQHCSSCHRPMGSAPFSLMTFDQVKSRARLIATVTAEGVMPPWKPEPGFGTFVGERRLTSRQVALIRQWAEQGAVEGNAADGPPPPLWRGGWQLGQPDLVREMPQPYVLPAGGGDVLRNFVVSIPVTGQRYVKGIEFLPGSPAIHHANMRIDETAASRQLDQEDPEPGYEGVTASSARFPDGQFLGWTPGQVRPLATDDLSWTLRPGSDLVLQLHLRPTGKPETIQPRIGLFFTATPPARVPVMIRLERQDIDIPAGDSDYVIQDQYVLPVDAELHELQPHAHYLARQIQGFARLPDGTTRWLIYIKRWDFSWQDVYRLADPMWLPKGTTLVMRYGYDNSSENSRRVRFGQRSSDEMGSLWLQVFPRTREDRLRLEREVQRKMLREDITGFEQLLSADENNASLYENLAACYLELGEGDVALSHLRSSLRLNPHSAVAQGNIGKVLVTLGKSDEAIPHLEEALSLGLASPASVHNALGVALQQQNKIDDAMSHFRQALILDPSSAFAHNNMGRAFQVSGRFDEAIDQFQQAARLRPEDSVPHLNLARVMVARGRVQDGVTELRAALDRRPDWPEVLIELAWILAAHTDPAIRAPREAVLYASRAAELTVRRQPKALDVLAAAFAASSEFERAIETAHAALTLAVSQGDNGGAEQIRGRLKLYEQRRPYRVDFSGSRPAP
jgi:tetratricopeptide (TPR) repeat protein